MSQDLIFPQCTIEQFLKGEVLPGFGMEEAKALTKFMEMAYAGK